MSRCAAITLPVPPVPVSMVGPVGVVGVTGSGLSVVWRDPGGEPEEAGIASSAGFLADRSGIGSGGLSKSATPLNLALGAAGCGGGAGGVSSAFSSLACSWSFPAFWACCCPLALVPKICRLLSFSRWRSSTRASNCCGLTALSENVASELSGPTRLKA